MKGKDEKSIEDAVRLETQRVTLLAHEVARECFKRRLDFNFIEAHISEISLIMDSYISEEQKLCKEITGRPPTVEEVISAVTDRVIKYVEQNQKIEG